jgi:hypothetical protein
LISFSSSCVTCFANFSGLSIFNIHIYSFVAATIRLFFLESYKRCLLHCGIEHCEISLVPIYAKKYANTNFVVSLWFDWFTRMRVLTLSNQKSQILLNFIFFPSLSSLVTNFEHGDNPTTNHTYEYLLGDQRSSKFGLIWECTAFEENGRIFKIKLCLE